VRLGFEGGQLPLIKRLPKKRGFTNIFKLEYNVVNVAKLNIFPSGTEVTPEELLRAGLIKSLKLPIKILGEGELEHPLLVKADKFSAIAERKIAAAGGKAERI
jgi:large subunit ribosomal protein L15